MRASQAVPLVCLVFLKVAAVQAASQDLQTLRQDLAESYLEMSPHLELAKWHLDQGDRLLAFYLLDGAMRHFEQEEFDREFRRIFVDGKPFDKSPEAEARLLAKVAGDEVQAADFSKLADIYISRNDWEPAKRYLEAALELAPTDLVTFGALVEVHKRMGREKEARYLVEEFQRLNPKLEAAFVERSGTLLTDQNLSGARQVLEEGLELYPESGALLFNLAFLQEKEGAIDLASKTYERAARADPESVYIQGNVGKFFLKVVNDDRKALEYYLSAYFLDPHYYDWEYAEFRIRSIQAELGQQTLDRLLAEEASGALSESKAPLIGALRHPDPMVVGLALDRAVEDWDESLLEPVVELLSHDDPGIRYPAARALRDRAGDAIETLVESLLASSDLRKRALAAHLLVPRQGELAFDTMREFLRSEVQLLRLDACLALAEHGGPEGWEIVLDHKTRETHPRLVQILESWEAQRDSSTEEVP